MSDMSETDFRYSEMEIVNPDEAILLHKKLAREDQIACDKRFLQLTLESGDLEFAKWHALRCPCHSIEDLVYAATWIGRQDVVNWVCRDWLHIRRFRSQKSRPRCCENVISPSVETPFTVLEERYSSELEIREALMDLDERAALWLGQRDEDLEGIPVTTTLFDVAATRGYLNIVTHLQRKQIVSCTVIGIYGAIKGGHHQILSCLYGNQHGVTNWPRRQDEWQVLQRFLNPVDKKMLQLFRHHLKMRLPARDLEMATYHDNFDRVRLTCELDLVEDIASSISIAAVRGDMPMLETLHSNPGLVRYSTLALDGAAEEGYLSIVRYLDERRAPRTRTAVDLSAANGHYDVVFYLIERGNRCSPFALYLASLNGHTTIVMYLAKRLSMAMIDVERCIEVARNREISELLKEYRLSMRPTMWSSTRLHRRHRRRHVRTLNIRPFRSQIASFRIKELLFGQLVRQYTIVVATDGGGIFLVQRPRTAFPWSQHRSSDREMNIENHLVRIF